MIVAREPANSKEVEAVIQSMNGLGSSDYYFICGFWNNSECVGGAMMCKSDPSYVRWAFKVNGGVSIGKALRDLMSKLLAIHPRIKAKVALSNVKSLKLCYQMGWYNLYVEEGNQVIEFSRDTWKYQDRWKL